VQLGVLHDLVDGVAWCVHGERPAEVATVVGFQDEAHVTRHFRRLLGVTSAA
jgi:AraC-like DNA-binding protein